MIKHNVVRACFCHKRYWAYLFTKILLRVYGFLAGLMMGYALTSIVCGIFDVKHHLHLQVWISYSSIRFFLTAPYSQLVPHISRHHQVMIHSLAKIAQPETIPPVVQYWRLVTHHLAFSNSSDLLVAQLLLYGVGINIERQFGSVKYAVCTIDTKTLERSTKTLPHQSFAIVSTLMSTILEFSSLILLNRFGLNHIPPGPTALVFSILYQWYRLVPSAYHFRIFGVSLTNKSFMYILASQVSAFSLIAPSCHARLT